MDGKTNPKNLRKLGMLCRAGRNTLVRLERELAHTGERRKCGRHELTDMAIVRLQSLSREGRRLQRQRGQIRDWGAGQASAPGVLLD